MIASLPMYDRAETCAANDRLWQAIRARLGYGPQALLREGNLWDQWLSPDLVLSQTCGLPYRKHLHGKVQLICAPVFDLPDCPPGYYRSVFVARTSDPRNELSDFDGAVFAYNEGVSQSGWAAPNIHAQEQGVSLGEPVKSGGHYFSARMVADGRAELASLDILSWTLMQRHDAFAQDLKEVARTVPTPAMPFITAPGRDAEQLRDAITGGLADLAPQDRATLGLKGVTEIPAQAFLDIPTPPPPTSDPG